MRELDFVTFGVPPNEKLARKIKDAFDEIDLGPRADDFYYGGVTKPEVAAFQLVRFYTQAWKGGFRKKYVKNFFRCSGFVRAINKALAVRKEIESRADCSAICSAATDIFQEYDSFNYHVEKTREHMAAQRALIKNRRKFYIAVAAKDGECCARCGSIEKLELDHIKPIVFGGLSVLDNLQLLCAKCNNLKRTDTEDYRTKKAEPARVVAPLNDDTH